MPWALAAPAEGQLLYRITVRETPSVHDFLSSRDKHDPQKRGEYWFLYVGLSMFADAAQAEAIRDRFRQGQHVAEIPLAPDRGFMLARTRRTPGHYTVWGRPEDLLEVALDHRGYPG
jgi:hypothetical protein